MVSRIAAGVVAGLIALAATPRHRVKVEQKPDQADAIKKLEAEIAKLRAMEEELKAKLQHLRTESTRKDLIERVKKNQVELQIEDVKKRAQVEQERARAEFDRALKLRNDELKRAEIEFDRAAKLQVDDLKRAEIEFDRAAKFQDQRATIDEKVEKPLREKAKLAQIEQEKPSKLQDERARIAKEIDRLIELRTTGDKPKVVVLDFESAGQDKPKVVGFADKASVSYEKMSPQELKQVIVKLQTLLDEKMRNAEKPGGEKVKPYPGKPGFGDKVKPGTVSQDEILKRLDKLTLEVEEIRRSIKK